MGALEWPAVGSSAFSSPFVEFSAWDGDAGQAAALRPPPPPTPLRGGPGLTWFLLGGWALSR